MHDKEYIQICRKIEQRETRIGFRGQLHRDIPKSETGKDRRIESVRELAHEESDLRRANDKPEIANH